MNLNVFGLFLIEICNDDMQYPGLHKKHSDVDGDIIVQKL